MTLTALAGAAFAIVIAYRHGLLRHTLANTLHIAQHHGSKGLVPHAELNVGSPTKLRMPFALPIAAGCICTLLFQLSAGAR